MAVKPDLIIVGQVTIDDVVPPLPGPWRRQLGGSSLYAVAGARLWLDPARIGLVARRGSDYPFDIAGLLHEVGLKHIALPALAEAHLVEWLVYEPDGSRRSLPRNPELLEVGAEGTSSRPAGGQAYTDKLLAIAPCAADIPADWLPAAALHLCTQVGNRHQETLRAVGGMFRWVSVDPSPHYSRTASIAELAERLRGVTAFLPSANEVRGLLADMDPETLVQHLHESGFAEVALKRGALPVIVANGAACVPIPTAAVTAIDPTGAGDAFCGAYAACRLLKFSPVEAARRAALSAALVVGCSGVEAALKLETPTL